MDKIFGDVADAQLWSGSAFQIGHANGAHGCYTVPTAGKLLAPFFGNFVSLARKQGFQRASIAMRESARNDGSPPLPAKVFGKHKDR
jgi:hypothetical protein